jgi:superfamily II DNA or RNA helicase
MRPVPTASRLFVRCAHAFTEEICERGDRYEEEGRVGEIDVDGTELEATVKGSGRAHYRVRASKADPELITLLCGCPWAARLNTCKHMWALLLALDDRGLSEEHFAGEGPLDVMVRYGSQQRLFPFSLDDDEEPGEIEDLDEVDEDEDEDTDHRGTFDDFDDRRYDFSSGYGYEQPSWRSPLNKLQGTLAAWSGRAEGLRPRRGSCFLELHLRRTPFGSAQLKLMAGWRRVLKDGSLGGFERGGANHRRLLTRAETLELKRLGGESIRYANPWTTEVTVPREAAASLLKKLCASERLGWVDVPDDLGRGSEPFVPLRWDGDEPFTAVLDIDPHPDGGLWAQVILERGEERVTVEDAIQLAEGVVVLHDRIVTASASATAWLSSLGKPTEIPEEDADELFAELAQTPDLPELRIDPSLDVTVEAAAPRPRLSIDTLEPRGGDLPVTLELGYGEEMVPLELATSGSWDPERRIFSRRDLEQERRLLNRLGELGFRATKTSGELRIDAADFDAATATLLDEGWDLRVRNKRFRRGRSVSLSVSSGQDWFELTADADFGGASVGLPALLKAVQSGKRWVKLDDGSQGLLPAEWLDRLGVIGRGQAEGDAVRYTRAQGVLLDAGLERLGVQVDEGLRKLRKELRAFDRIRPRKGPRSFQGELRPYQKLGLGWLGFLQRYGFGGCLADDMGLGKTVQVLALLDGRRSQPKSSLVVAPRSLLFNWASEAARFAPKLRVLTYHGPDRRELLPTLDDYDLVLTTYGTARRDHERLAAHRFDYVVLDEAQAIKNPTSQIARACCSLTADHRLALTGTPIENSLGDLASILDFLNPGMIDSVDAMKALAEAGDPSTEERSMLARALRPFVLRRTKDEVLTDLPDKTEQILRCEMPTKEREDYDELLDHYRSALRQRIDRDGLGRSKIHVLEALLRLRQAACHPGLLDPARRAEGSAKIDTLVDQLTEVLSAGHKALVFSQFTTLLGIVRERLEREGIAYAYLDGSTTNRQEVVERFQDDEDCPVFLLSLKAGGTGLNLTAAGYVFLLDPWWNPAVEAQAIDRAHRIGQTRPVMAYRLVAKDTVEDRILELQDLKRELAEEILEADNRGLGALEASDLEVLLG